MELSEFVRLAAETDREEDEKRGLQIALHGIAGEAGSVVSEAKKWFREGSPPTGLAQRVGEELGDLLWYVAAVARRVGLDLDQVVADNLTKTARIFTDSLPEPARYDDERFPERQRLLRKMRVRFIEDTTGAFPIVRMEPLGELGRRIEEERQRKQLGDDLNDNADEDDGYRYHDVIHFAHAAVLGWSPVLRSLMGAKRKADPRVDRVEDGARAIAAEEGLVAFVFRVAEEQGFLEGATRLDWELVKHVRRTVQGLEVASQPPIAWSHAYLQAFSAFRRLRDAHGGVIECDLDAQRLIVINDAE